MSEYRIKQDLSDEFGCLGICIIIGLFFAGAMIASAIRSLG